MTDQYDRQLVTAERRGHILVLTLDRPEARNAVNAEVSTQIGRHLEQAENDTDVRVVVLTGAGDVAFSAGADLKAIGAGRSIYSEDHPEWGLAGLVDNPLSVPLIAAVNGTALGGGCEMAMACDLVVAAENATFGLPEVTRGLFAGAGGVFRLPALVPPRVAMEMMLTGEPISAARALEIGLVNRVVPFESLLDEALALAETIAANAPLATRASKRVALGIVDGARPGEEPNWAHSNDEFVALLSSEDSREGTRAFAEKRAAEWTGR